MRFATIEEFAAERRSDQDDLEKTLFPIVAEAVKAYPVQGWYDELLRDVSRLYADTYHREGGSGTPSQVDGFIKDVRDTLEKTDEPDDNTVDRLSVWLATAILNAATMEAAGTDEEFVVMEWVTMNDEDVRDTHQELEGQQRPVGEAFEVAGEKLRYPGDPTAPIELWINCRCSLAPTQPNEFTKATTEETTMTAATEPGDDLVEPIGPIPWHGVLAPEGEWSGDGRSFAPGALTHRNLPLPLTYQKATASGHDGSCTVAKIEQIARVDGEVRGCGTMLSTAEANEAIGMIAEFGRFGVSVDADDAEFDFDETTGKVEFTKARIASASIVAIPAFAQAYVALGEAPPGFLGPDAEESEVDVCDEESPDYDEAACAEKQQPEDAMALVAARLMKFVSDKPWSNFTQADYTDEQWKRACIMHVCDGTEKSCHKLPIKEPGGALNRNGVHAAASRFNQVQGPTEAKAAAKSALRGAYRQLGEEPPDAIKSNAAVESFDRGPGWLTDPIPTKRIHDYWTKPGEEGYAKIGWGRGGDFNRCRTLVGEKIAANSPEDLIHLDEICARWHHDALGIWPGEHQAAAESAQFASEDTSPALSLVAAGGWCAPSEWFDDPKFDTLTPITITEEGQVYGHMAGWKTCHTAYKGICVAPPHSVTGYADFLTGYVQTTDGPRATGPWTYDTGHASPGSRRSALAHYDNTGTVAADIAVGEDDFGIWVAGMMRPGAPDEAAHILRASAPSGDWRRNRAFDHLSPEGKAMEMCALLSVNTQGFPVPRVGISNGEQESLVAAGVIEWKHLDEGNLFDGLVSKMVDELGRRKQKMSALAARVGGN